MTLRLIRMKHATSSTRTSPNTTRFCNAFARRSKSGSWRQVTGANGRSRPMSSPRSKRKCTTGSAHPTGIGGKEVFVCKCLSFENRQALTVLLPLLDKCGPRYLDYDWLTMFHWMDVL